MRRVSAAEPCFPDRATVRRTTTRCRSTRRQRSQPCFTDLGEARAQMLARQRLQKRWVDHDGRPPVKHADEVFSPRVSSRRSFRRRLESTMASRESGHLNDGGRRACTGRDKPNEIADHTALESATTVVSRPYPSFSSRSVTWAHVSRVLCCSPARWQSLGHWP